MHLARIRSRNALNMPGRQTGESKEAYCYIVYTKSPLLRIKLRHTHKFIQMNSCITKRLASSEASVPLHDTSMHKRRDLGLACNTCAKLQDGEYFDK